MACIERSWILSTHASTHASSCALAAPGKPLASCTVRLSGAACTYMCAGPQSALVTATPSVPTQAADVSRCCSREAQQCSTPCAAIWAQCPSKDAGELDPYDLQVLIAKVLRTRSDPLKIATGGEKVEIVAPPPEAMIAVTVGT